MTKLEPLMYNKSVTQMYNTIVSYWHGIQFNTKWRLERERACVCVICVCVCECECKFVTERELRKRERETFNMFTSHKECKWWKIEVSNSFNFPFPLFQIYFWETQLFSKISLSNFQSFDTKTEVIFNSKYSLYFTIRRKQKKAFPELYFIWCRIWVFQGVRE